MGERITAEEISVGDMIGWTREPAEYLGVVADVEYDDAMRFVIVTLESGDVIPMQAYVTVIVFNC